jgi:hypothetical protein
VSRRFDRSEHVLWRRAMEGVVLVSRRSPGLMVLEDASADLWMKLEGPMTVTEAAGRLSDDPSEDMVVAAAQLLDRLALMGLASVSEVGEGAA